MSRLFRVTARQAPVPVDPEDARRPSHWNKDINQYEQDPQLEYPTEMPDHVQALGFTPPPNPTPVYLTESPPHARRIVDWAAQNVTVDATTPVQLSGADRRRQRMLVTNTGDTNAVYLSQGREDHLFMCYLLEPNQTVELMHNDFVWARCAPTLSTVVTWFTEYQPAEA